MKGSLPLPARAIAKAVLTICLLSLVVTPSVAQNYNGDARAIALGSLTMKNDAATMAGKSRSYSSFVLPLGLFQLVKNRKVFDPGDPEFDPLKTMSFLTSPVHYTFSRDEGDSAERLVRDLVNGGINRNLTTYRGFVPQSRLTAQGLVAPDWGKTLRLYGEKDAEIYQGVYFGAGPYLSVGTDVSIDQGLIDVLKSTAAAPPAFQQYNIQDFTDGQVAAAVKMGYRVKVPVPGISVRGSNRDGLYVSATYNYLHGIHYDTAALNVRFDTDAQGLVSLNPTTIPLVATHESSEKGRGFALDLATDIVIDRWDFRFALDGIANRIEWQDLKAEQYVLNSLLQNLDFTQTTVAAPVGNRRVELPTRYSAGGSYNTDRWTVDTDFAHGLQNSEFRSGAEYRWALFEFRAGTRYVRDQWQPATGIGFNLTKRLGIDVAFFGTSTNLEKARKATTAVSLRLNREDR